VGKKRVLNGVGDSRVLKIEWIVDVKSVYVLHGQVSDYITGQSISVKVGTFP
jgi:hypothetical protein